MLDLITPHHGKDEEKPSGPLRLKMETRRQPDTKERQYLVWEDQGNAKLESLVEEIVVAMILEAEIRHRNGVLGHHEWLIEYKAREIEAEKQRIIEAERQAIARKKHVSSFCMCVSSLCSVSSSRSARPAGASGWSRCTASTRHASRISSASSGQWTS